MIRFDDKVVLITGGTKGIGAACVKMFAETGASVAFTYNSDKRAAEKIRQNFSTGRVDLYTMDLAREKSISDTIEKVISDFKRIDILVNNAGIWEYGEIDKMSLDDWERTIRINLTGTFIVSRSVIPVMKQNMSGRIINISSTSGQRGEAFYSHYSASKGGVVSFTKSMALELAPYNINVNCVAPGWVDTEMTAGVFSDKEYKESIRKGIPIGRIASPADIAGPVLFLASALANHITGEILNVNGGSVLCG